MVATAVLEGLQSCFVATLWLPQEGCFLAELHDSKAAATKASHLCTLLLPLRGAGRRRAQSNVCMGMQYATSTPQHFRLSPNMAPAKEACEALLLVGLPGEQQQQLWISRRQCGSAHRHQKLQSLVSPSTLALCCTVCLSVQCNVALCGCAGSGKSAWAEKYARGNHNFTVLGINAALDQMRVRICFLKQRFSLETIG